MRILEDFQTKLDKRERKRKNSRKMKVHGASAKLWQRLIIERAKKLEESNNALKSNT